ncbi:MAG: phosphonate C-P lyase system protein PhnG [Ilumatobacter sp.]|jgi:alpha-D-ribose 1-methylphosphonate 5-triphosphate synthase subunit PhnG|uniref:phosphonate C-P lyase system protein PhnG n=1 Tax=Ilumatobacter sp. TaxID=1967498 RepID=UPI003919C78D
MNEVSLARTRERRAELLSLAAATELEQVADDLLGRLGAPTVTSPPETGLVMLQVREPVCRDRFHVGEVVVSRAEVMWLGSAGWSMRLGCDRGAAVAAALCDAAAELDGGSEAVADLCDRVEARLADEAHAEWAALAPTRVTFEELD